MAEPALTAEPYFWIKQVWLPVGVTIATTVATIYWNRVLQVIKKGRRAAAKLRIDKEINLLLALREAKPGIHTLITIESARSHKCIAQMVLGVGFLVMAEALNMPYARMIVSAAGSLLVGYGLGGVFASSAAVEFYVKILSDDQALETKLRDRLNKLNS